MAIEINKPAPLKIGSHYHYTLSSYEPVTITVMVPQVTPTDVEFALENIAREHGTTGQDVTDQWVEKNIEGMKTVEELKDALRKSLEHMNADYAEQSKLPLAAEALAERLQQSIPMEEIARYREQVRQAMAFEAMQQGLDLDTYLAQSGIPQASFDAMLDDRAAHAAGQQAALSAFAAEKKLTVDEGEIPNLLQLSPADASQVIEQARAAGQYDDLEADCLNMKAARVLVSECTCNYERETPEAAAARDQQFKAILEMMRQQDAEAAAADSADEKDGDDGLKLV